MGKKFFEYSQHFEGRTYKDLTPEEKKEYRRIANANFRNTRVTKFNLSFYNSKEQDMMILYFLNNVVAQRQPFIKRVLWEYILNNAPEYVDKLGKFKYDHDVEQKHYSKL